MRRVAILLAAVLLTGPVLNAAGADQGRAGPTNVLVLYRADDADRDKDGTPDSEAVAKYYAARRGVPAENLFGVKLAPLKRDYDIEYAEFFERLAKPLAARLAEKVGDGRPLSAHICYIAVCPGVPSILGTHHAQPPEEKKRDWFAYTARRSLDQWLIALDENVKAGVNETSGAPGDVGARLLGATMAQCILPTYGAFAREGFVPFRQLRESGGGRFNFYLVTRLGDTPEHARNMIDGGLWAERYLRLPDAGETPPWTPTIWLDQKHPFAGDAVASMAMAVALVRGSEGSPLAGDKGLRRPWPVVIDNVPAEIGDGGKEGVPHLPTVTAKATAAAAVAGQPGVFQITLAEPGKAGPMSDVQGKAYFPVGWEVGNGKTTGRVVGASRTENALLVRGGEGWAAGDALTATWGGRYPADDCFIFYGFYGLGRYEDVFRFPPGALGVHVDSSCMNWAKGAMDRGIAASFGVTSEPLSIGIPHGHLWLMALARGADFAESIYGSLRLGQRWCGVAMGDPLYAPFRSLQLKDATPPAPGPGKATSAGGRVTLSVELEGGDADRDAEVAMFRLEYGPTEQYGQAVDYFDWPEPEKGRGVKGRRFGYSRSARWTLGDLEKGRTYHYRVIARDPAGHETATKDATFVP
ncbi:MAG: hypothetical protein BIFFINMI_01202 [Phycisphaerae bacterium]|nr:hypothetical protein [Phycisphaerae bacterium]